jgi:hypothetical protein
VIVGTETLPSRITGRPATKASLAVVVFVSGNGLTFVPDATPGHIGKVKRWGAGGQPYDCANRLPDSATAATQRRNALIFMGESFSTEIFVLPFGCETIYPRLPPLAIFLALVPKPKTRPCATRHLPEPKSYDLPHSEALSRTLLRQPPTS